MTALPGAALLAQQEPVTATLSTSETVGFVVLGALSVAGALGMLFSRNAVHSALWLAVTMLSLGVLYMVQSAPFLGFVQIIVYTGAIMMLFLFVLMLVGRDAGDSVVEVLRGQRLTAGLAGLGFGVLVVAALARSFGGVVAEGVPPPQEVGGNVSALGGPMFTDYLFPFELTSALLITAAVGAMVLAFSERDANRKIGQRETLYARLRDRGARISPRPGPGVFATANSVATPALLPDGSVAPDSLSEVLAATAQENLESDIGSVAGSTGHAEAYSLTPGQPEEGERS